MFAKSVAYVFQKCRPKWCTRCATHLFEC